MRCLKCGGDISHTQDEGVNETDYFECLDCNLGFNVNEFKLDGEEDEDELQQIVKEKLEKIKENKNENRKKNT